jgi:hypothetical protein
VYDPATLLVAFARVAGNTGANTPGVNGLTAADVELFVGVPGFLDDLPASIKDGSFRPLRVRQRLIPKGRRLAVGRRPITARRVSVSLSPNCSGCRCDRT